MTLSGHGHTRLHIYVGKQIFLFLQKSLPVPPDRVCSSITCLYGLWSGLLLPLVHHPEQKIPLDLYFGVLVHIIFINIITRHHHHHDLLINNQKNTYALIPFLFDDLLDTPNIYISVFVICLPSNTPTHYKQGKNSLHL